MNYPFDTTALAGDVVDRLAETYQLLRSKFNVEPTGDIDFRLGDFETFRNYCGFTLRGSFVIKTLRNNSYILFTECEYASAGAKGYNGGTEYQVWGLAYLKENFGRVLIRRETFADKLIELVTPVEIDFADDKAFSDTFTF
jgi:hypothetical protein